MPYAMANGLTMYYEAHGLPSGPPLVLLHGFTLTSDSWAPQRPAFGAHYRLIAPDMRGHGRTHNPDGVPAMNHRQFARDVIALCQTLGIERASFCGESSGAMQLLTLALDAPALVQALVLAGGTYFLDEQVRTWMRGRTPETVLSEVGLAGEDVDARRARHTAHGPETWRDVAEAFIALGAHAHTDDFPEPETLRGITAPVLIVHGDRDDLFPVDVPLAPLRAAPGCRAVRPAADGPSPTDGTSRVVQRDRARLPRVLHMTPDREQPRGSILGAPGTSTFGLRSARS